MSNPKETTLFDDLMAGLQEVHEYLDGKRELRTTTLSTDDEDDWDGPYEPVYAAVMREQNGVWMAFVPDLPGVLATGAYQDEAEANIAQEIQFYLAALREKRIEPPKPATYVRMMNVEQMSAAAWAEEKAYRQQAQSVTAGAETDSLLVGLK